MLKIRHAQVAILGRDGRLTIAQKIAARLRSHWQRWCARFDEDELLAWVRDGIECAQAHGLQHERDLAHYLNLMVALGPRFDRDPNFPWAKALLEDEAIASRHTMRQLNARALDWLRDTKLEAAQ